MEVVFYTRRNCPLCEEAKSILHYLKREHNITITEKDIETSDELTERFGLMIPVVEIAGELVQYGQIDMITVEEKLMENQ